MRRQDLPLRRHPQTAYKVEREEITELAVSSHKAGAIQQAHIAD
jgi:hypothetical protein